MASQLRAALAALCRRHGWSYGLVWRVDHCDPRLLMVEESYCEEKVYEVVENVLNRVHIVGEGSVGRTIISGKDAWIYSDVNGTDSSYDPKSSLAIADLMQQFSAGIKTIVIVSLPSTGAVQFGSTVKILESFEFIKQAKQLFELIETVPVPLYNADPLKGTKILDQPEAFACLLSAADVSSVDYENTESFHSKYKNHKIDRVSNRGTSQSFVVYPGGTAHEFRSQYVEPYPLSNPITSCYTGSSVTLQKSDSSSRPSVLSPSKLDHAVSTEALISISSSPKASSDLDSHERKVSTYNNTSSWNKIPSLPTIEQRMLSGMGMVGYSNLFHTSPSFFPSESLFQQLYADSSSSSGQYRLYGSMPGARNSVVNDACTSVSGNLQLLHQDLCDAKPIYDAPLSSPERLGSAVANLQNCLPECTSFLHRKDNHLIQLTDQQPGPVNFDLTMQMNEIMLAVSSTSSNLDGSDATGCNAITKVSRPLSDSSSVLNSQVLGSAVRENSSVEHAKQLFDCDLFDGMELDFSSNNFVQQYWDDIIMPVGKGKCSNLGVNTSETQMVSTIGARKAMSPGPGSEQLLDAIVGQTINESSSYGSLAENANPISAPDMENQFSILTTVGGPPHHRSQLSSVCLPSTSQTSSVMLPHFVSDAIHGSMKKAMSKSSVSSWIDDCCSLNNENSVLTQSRKPEDAAKVKKRARPGESTRPRPKDRQQIQDRVKELRELVPNGAKCSIDALLDRTIKHMLFLQSVTKYADKLKQADKPKMIVEESGVVLRDNCCDSSSGGATWAYEVAGQTMVCPIMVEDLTPPGQMLVEMLCEERGIFLEIADTIRGFGLTILKGVMEIRERKIWARFVVEANRDVTRLDIFLSLVQLLQQNGAAKSSEQATKAVDTGDPVFMNYHQAPITI